MDRGDDEVNQRWSKGIIEAKREEGAGKEDGGTHSR